MASFSSGAQRTPSQWCQRLAVWSYRHFPSRADDSQSACRKSSEPRPKDSVTQGLSSGPDRPLRLLVSEAGVERGLPQLFEVLVAGTLLQHAHGSEVQHAIPA